MKKFKIIAALMLVSFVIDTSAQTFYDNAGKPALYYNSANNILFDYSGNPRFYFTFDNLKKINVYDFEGRHIAWLSEGIIRDHEGRILASQNGRIINITYALEPIKPIEKIAPLKKIEQIAPIQPIFKNEFSTSHILYQWSSNSTTQSSSGYLQNDYSSRATFNPYELPSDAIYNALKSLNERHNNLLAQGYIYDGRTDKYYTKEQYATIEAKRNVISKSFYDVMIEAKNSTPNSFNFKKPRKKTWYMAYFGNPEIGVFSAKVLIKKNGKIRGFYMNHPQYGYMFFGLYGKPRVTFPYTDVNYVGDISKLKRAEVGRFGSSFLKGRGAFFWHRGLTETTK